MMNFKRGGICFVFVIFLLSGFCAGWRGEAQNGRDSAKSASSEKAAVSSGSSDFSRSDDSPLLFGNPSGAVRNVSAEDNYLMEKADYSLSYNNITLEPNWVAWHLSAGDIGDAGRSNKFMADGELPEGWYKVTASDYKFTMYGFDRGHVCPSADRTLTLEANQQTFLMTNMLPQSPDLNRIVWVSLEKYERELALSGKELYIFAGGAGEGGEGQRGSFNEIPLKVNGDAAAGESREAGAAGKSGNVDFSARRPSTVSGNAIKVPAFCWKILLILPAGDDDAARVAASPETAIVIAVLMPNRQGLQKLYGDNTSWKSFTVSVDALEDLTGYDFFSTLPESVQTVLEEKVYHE